MITTNHDTSTSLPRAFGRTELALLYSPDCMPMTAWRRLQQWIEHYPGLTDSLAAHGYRPSQRIFTPQQVALIFQAIGEP